MPYLERFLNRIKTIEKYLKSNRFLFIMWYFECIIQIFVELIFWDKADNTFVLLNLCMLVFSNFLSFLKLIIILFSEFFYRCEKHIFQDTSFSLSLTSWGESFQYVTQSFVRLLVLWHQTDDNLSTMVFFKIAKNYLHGVSLLNCQPSCCRFKLATEYDPMTNLSRLVTKVIK